MKVEKRKSGYHVRKGRIIERVEEGRRRDTFRSIVRVVQVVDIH